MNNETNNKMINQYINLKAKIIQSLRAQKLREDWTYPTLRNIGFTVKDKVYTKVK